MEFTKPFSNLSKKDANIAGGKGASLGEMSQSGIPVPPGFVVLSSTFDHFLKETDLTQEIDAILKTVDHKAIHTVESASEKIRGLIENEDVPADIAKEIKEEFKKLGSQFVAVRSSATAEDGADHAWAGQLESFLNTDESTLLDNVRKCWGSLFTPRAIFYRFEKGLHGTQISVAVVVQKMVQSEISGIAFSVHPITEDYNQLIIEAGFGLGEAIVSGSVTPDSYVVEKSPLKILDINVSTQTRALIRANRKMGGDEFGEVNEWIDIPEPKASSQVLTENQILELSKIIIGIENHYGFPCDIEWAFESGKFYIVQSRPITTLTKTQETKDVFSAFHGFTFLPEGGRTLHGHIGYAIIHSYTVELPEWPMPIKPIIESKNHVAKWYFVVKDESEFTPFLDACVTNPDILSRLEKEIIKETEGIIQAVNEKELGKLDDKDLSTLFTKYYSALENMIRLAGMVRYLDRAIIYQFRQAFNNADEYLRTISISDKLTFVSKEQIAIWEIAKKIRRGKTLEDPEVKEDIKNVYDQFKWCSMGYYLETPKSIEDYRRAVTEIKEDPVLQIEQLQNKHKADLELRNKTIKDLTDDQKAWAHVAATSTYLKDFYKYSVSQIIYHADHLFDELSRRTGKDKGYLKDLIPSETEKLITTKSLDENFSNEFTKQHVIFLHNNEFKILVGKEAEEFSNSFLSVTNKDDKSFKGRVASGGKGTGTAKVIINTSDFAKFKDGDILIAINTSPDFVPLMRMASAIVAEEGGLTSHTSVVSRELGVPCVVGVTGICSIIKDGDMVEVDADSGVVRILSQEKSSNTVEEIKKLSWFKSWEAKFPMFLVTIGAPGYFDAMKEAFGFELGHFLVITHEGILAGFWVEKELIAFGNHLSKFAEKDPEIIVKWSLRLKKETDECRALMSKGRDYFLNAEHFRELRRKDEVLSAYQVAVREVINYLPDELREKYTPDLEGARKHSETIFFELGDIVTSVLKHVAEKENLSLDLAGCMTGDELEKYFEEHLLPDSDTLQARYKCSGFINHPQFEWLREDDIAQIEKSFVENTSDEIKGQPAYKGKVTGRAQVIKNFSAVSDFPRGDILVTGMTDPNYLPIMERAGAIVTDAGGLLCHAAIVSREMKKPCIVGTKIATHLIKTGDMVEVDADSGVVRIIK